MKNLKKSKENKELRDQELNKVAGGIIVPEGLVSYVECPKCKIIYGFTRRDGRRCPNCGFGR